MCFKINCLDVDKWLNIEAHWSCHFTFQENLPRGMFWLDHIVSISKSVTDKQSITSLTLSLSHIFHFDISRPSRLVQKFSSHPQSSSSSIKSFIYGFFLVFFTHGCNCLNLGSSRLVFSSFLLLPNSHPQFKSLMWTHPIPLKSPRPNLQVVAL